MPTFVQEVESGDRLRALQALRHELAEAIGGERSVNCPVCTSQVVHTMPTARDLPALALRLERVLEQIEQAGGSAPEEEDELAKRRDAKLSAASGS